jgi:hypothetical protein
MNHGATEYREEKNTEEDRTQFIWFLGVGLASVISVALW